MNLVNQPGSIFNHFQLLLHLVSFVMFLTKPTPIMNLSLPKLAKLNFTKGIILAIYALLIVLNDDFTYSFFKYVLLGEIIIYGIAIMSINGDRNDALPMVLSITSVVFMVIYITAIFFYLDYRIYYVNMVMLNYWVGSQLIYLLIYNIYIIKMKRNTWWLLAAVYLLATFISLKTIFNTGVYGDKRHITIPVLAWGIFYITTGYFLIKTNKHNISSKK